jgi:hypothetical protein
MLGEQERQAADRLRNLAVPNSRLDGLSEPWRLGASVRTTAPSRRQSTNSMLPRQDGSGPCLPCSAGRFGAVIGLADSLHPGHRPLRSTRASVFGCVGGQRRAQFEAQPALLPALTRSWRTDYELCPVYVDQVAHTGQMRGNSTSGCACCHCWAAWCLSIIRHNWSRYSSKEKLLHCWIVPSRLTDVRLRPSGANSTS